MGFSGTGASWDTLEKMAKDMAGYVACMGEDNTFLMKMNSLNIKAKLKNFNLHTKGCKVISGLKEQVKMNCR